MPLDPIDEKRDEMESQGVVGFTKSMTEYLTAVVISIVVAVVYFCFGSGTLLLCKIAQSNYLPDDVNVEPYTSAPQGVQPVEINFLVTDDNQSQRMTIADPGFGALLKSLANPQSYLALFFTQIFSAVFAFNFGAVNSVFGLMNQLPEWTAVVFGPLVWVVLFLVLIVATCVYFPFLWLYNLGFLFRKDGDINNKETVGGFNSWWRWCLLILFVLLLGAAMALGPLVGIIAAGSALFSFLSYTGLVKTADPDEDVSVSFFSLIPEVFRHFKVTFMMFVSVLIIQDTFQKLGFTPGWFAIATVIMIYLGVLPNSMFQAGAAHKEMGAVLGPLASYEKAKKGTQAGGAGKPRWQPTHAPLFGGGQQLLQGLDRLNKFLAKRS